MEHTAQKTGFPSAQEAAEKYYSVAPIRPATHVPIHGGAIPIQQPPQVRFTCTHIFAAYSEILLFEHTSKLLLKS
jgi:hypothetical protein